MPPRNAAAPGGSGASDANSRPDHPIELLCHCGGPNSALIEGRVLGGLAILSIPVCDQHVPQNHAQAERLIAATLIAIADAVGRVDFGVARGRRRSRNG